jgi:hypothetical protein
MPASPTPTRSAASRTNGAKSKGPTTPEGRARAALNGLPPGPRLLHVRFLEGEDPVLLENLRRSRLRALQPEDADELAAVEAMVRAEWHLIRLDRLLDTQVAGRSAEEFLRAVIGGRWGQDVMEHLGRWRERGERSLDRAHRRFLRQRQARRKGLVEGAAEPADLPPAANENRGEGEAAAAVQKSAGEPDAAAARAAAALYRHLLGLTERAGVAAWLMRSGPVERKLLRRAIADHGPLAGQPEPVRWAWQGLTVGG